MVKEVILVVKYHTSGGRSRVIGSGELVGVITDGGPERAPKTSDIRVALRIQVD